MYGNVFADERTHGRSFSLFCALLLFIATPVRGQETAVIYDELVASASTACMGSMIVGYSNSKTGWVEGSFGGGMFSSAFTADELSRMARQEIRRAGASVVTDCGKADLMITGYVFLFQVWDSPSWSFENDWATGVMCILHYKVPLTVQRPNGEGTRTWFNIWWFDGGAAFYGKDRSFYGKAARDACSAALDPMGEKWRETH